MKINSIVLIEHSKVIRSGVVTKNITTEEFDHTSVSCEIRLSDQTKITTNSVLVVDMTEIKESHDFISHPALALIRMSADWESSARYAVAKAANPGADPDEIPF